MVKEIFTPAFVIGVPVGFVNVEVAKELIIESGVPHIVNRGQKEGLTMLPPLSVMHLYMEYN